MIFREVGVRQIVMTLGHHVREVHGCADATINNICDTGRVNAASLDWIGANKNDKQGIAEKSLARVILVDSDVSYSKKLKQGNKTLIVVDNPKVAIAIIGNEYFVEKPSRIVHETSLIESADMISDDVSVGPFSHVGKARIGSGTIIGSNVRIYDDVTIGAHCVIKDGAVIGGDGFGFEKDEDGNWFRFPQIGDVVIGDYVEVGANTCIDRGALSTTSIGDYTKINNLCHIAHNNVVGRNVVIAAHVNLSGGNIIEDDCWIAPNASLRGYIHVGKGSTVGMGAVVVKDIPSGEVWIGNPARKLR